MDVRFLLPHEFLFLLCNCFIREDMIKKYHKGLRKTENFCQITSWELTDGTGRPQKEVQGQRWYRQMHLLDDDAFINKKPDRLI